MKKVISLLLAALMVMGCAAASAAVVVNNAGPFPISFELKEGSEVVFDGWSEVLGANMYQASIKGSDGLFFYFSVSAPVEIEADASEEVSTEPVTYNEANGYTDELIKAQLKDAFSAEFDSFDVDVLTTGYGTKLAVVQFNDAESPYVYMYTIYKGYEVGLTAISQDENGNYKPVTDAQLQNVLDFVTELWMGAEAKYVDQ